MDTDESQVTLIAAKNYSICTVCVETLMPPIYQCCNGHVVCCNCVERIEKCVECRVPLSKLTKIRNIALEKIINNLRVDCTNKTEGCEIQMTIERLRSHLQDCPFTPFSFCASLLGRKDCTFKVNDSSIISHLDECHAVTKVHTSTFRLCMNVAKISLGENDFFFEPVLVTSMKVPLLIRSVVSDDGFFTFSGIVLQTNEDDLQSIRLEFRLASQANKVSWTGCGQSYRKFQETNIFNNFRIPMDSLLEFWRVSSQENSAMTINVFVWETSALSQEDDSVEEVHIFEQSEHPRNIPHLQRASAATHSQLMVQSGDGSQLSDQASEDLLSLFYSPFDGDLT